MGLEGGSRRAQMTGFCSGQFFDNCIFGRKRNVGGEGLAGWFGNGLVFLQETLADHVSRECTTDAINFAFGVNVLVNSNA